MTASSTRGILAGITAAVVMALCGSAGGAAAQSATQHTSGGTGEQAAIARARADSARYPYTEADIAFMSGMIHHHSQAIAMSQWAPTHGASATVQRLAARIINAQRDEIGTMQRWLRDRRQPVPDSHDAGTKMMMNGEMHEMHYMHEMLMPGMLTQAQMKELDAARGRDFDRLFLTFMIQHHRGAVSMVKDLFGTYGAAQDELVFKFANDVNVDQTTEIARMQKLLAAVIFDDASSDGPAAERQ
jgi:uncharacterized protein (DUF305 family)